MIPLLILFSLVKCSLFSLDFEEGFNIFHCDSRSSSLFVLKEKESTLNYWLFENVTQAGVLAGQCVSVRNKKVWNSLNSNKVNVITLFDIDFHRRIKVYMSELCHSSWCEHGALTLALTLWPPEQNCRKCSNWVWKVQFYRRQNREFKYLYLCSSSVLVRNYSRYNKCFNECLKPNNIPNFFHSNFDISFKILNMGHLKCISRFLNIPLKHNVMFAGL